MNSWKTTLGGLLTAAGGALAHAGNPYLTAFGEILLIVGPIVLGASARDNSVTSEQAGAK
jgi:hypothetical protein